MNLATFDTYKIALEIYSSTCRTGFNAPGFCILNFGNRIDSITFRQLMVDIKTQLAKIHERETNKTLIYLSAGRFDQQESTKPHLDGGPQESLLMLGYEPTQIDSTVEIIDFSKCAFEFELTPNEFMAKYNPMFKSNISILEPYSTYIESFSKEDYQIVCINNSSSPYSYNKSWQGVLHNATIKNPNESIRRIINSTMIAPALLKEIDVISQADIKDFIHTSKVKRRGYDKLHLQDDK